MRSLDRTLGNAAGLAYVILARALWFGGGWMLIAWRIYSGLGVAGRRIAKGVSDEITGRIRTLSRPSAPSPAQRV